MVCVCLMSGTSCISLAIKIDRAIIRGELEDIETYHNYSSV